MITNLTSSAVISKIKAMSTRFGIPQTVVGDNGPCYSSQEFRAFAHSWDFKHITSSPLYPQSNGLAEKTVQPAKALMDKERAHRVNPYLSLLEYRNTPVDGLKSPAQLLMSRRINPTFNPSSYWETAAARTHPPQHSPHQKGNVPKTAETDRNTKTLLTLPSGATVRFQLPTETWKPATVTGPAATQRSYNSVTDEGQILRRNRRHLLQTQESDTGQQTHNNQEKPEDTELKTLQHTNTDPMGFREPSQLVSTRPGRIVKP
uniref:Integrase catalytic domain-containing protein n=1 Tax=Stegastes partitus TaxID=144197 RepID=A0A3B5A5R0_9TELE